MGRGRQATPYRPGGFILHPGVLAVVLVGVAVWLGLFFAGESTHGAVGIVVAVVLVVLGLWLGYFIFIAMTMEVVGLTIWFTDRTERKRRKRKRLPRHAHGAADLRYLYLVSAPALMAALFLGFGFGYLGGGVFWGVYAALLTVGAIAVSEFLVWRR